MNEPSNPGVKLPRGKPVVLTFYDRLQDHPYTSTFHVRDEVSLDQINALIKVVRDLSTCVLGRYKIGHDQYAIPDYTENLKTIWPYCLGTEKWLIQYRVEYGSARSVTIPGRKRELTLAGHSASGQGLKKRAHLPYVQHPTWQEFLKIFKTICCSSDGQAVLEPIKLDYSTDNWPPKGWKKRR